MFKADSQRSEKHLANKVKSDSIHQGVKAKYVETKYIWANEVFARMEYSIDLMASTSLYHKCCSIEFRLVKNIQKRLLRTTFQEQYKTVSSQMLDIKEKMPFCKL